MFPWVVWKVADEKSKELLSKTRTLIISKNTTFYDYLFILPQNSLTQEMKKILV